MPTYSLVRFFLIAVAAVMIFPYLPGSGSEGFRGVSVFEGLLISLGAASAIANLIAGIVITYMRPFRAGDRVKIPDVIGDVIDKDLFVVWLRAIKNVDITMPISLVLASHIMNFSSSAKRHGLILNTTVSIGYDIDWRKVHELLLQAAVKTDGVLAKR
ncbi:MAG: mechanosensitive ion channel domain-containing protein [Pseudomonadota bacterium]